MSKLRVLVKATLLSVAYSSPVIMVFIVFVLDLILLIIEYNNSKEEILRELNIRFPKVWAVNHVLCNVALLMLLYLPNILLSIVSCIILVMLILIGDTYIHY